MENLISYIKLNVNWVTAKHHKVNDRNLECSLSLEKTKNCSVLKGEMGVLSDEGRWEEGDRKGAPFCCKGRWLSFQPRESRTWEQTKKLRLYSKSWKLSVVIFESPLGLISCPSASKEQTQDGMKSTALLLPCSHVRVTDISIMKWYYLIN